MTMISRMQIVVVGSYLLLPILMFLHVYAYMLSICHDEVWNWLIKELRRYIVFLFSQHPARVCCWNFDTNSTSSKLWRAKEKMV